MGEKPLLVYVEDNEGDVLLLEESIREAALDCELQVLRDGEAALRYFGIKATADGVALPDLLLLDLHLPGADGKEILQYIRGVKRLGAIPIYVFAPKATFDRIREELGPGPEEQVTRPEDWQGYVTLAKRLKQRLDGKAR